jgi:hypothetical protein
MPLHLTADDDLVEIALITPGEWVRVKRALGRDEERARQRAIGGAARVAPDGAFLGIDAGLAQDIATFSTLELAIKAWCFRDRNGNPVPISARNIRALDDADLDIITARLDELYPAPRTEAEKKASSLSGPTPFSARETDGSPPNSGGSQ